MPLKNDGDLIRGLGFVTLYAAYLEEAIDECLGVLLADNQAHYDRLLKRPTSRKIEYLLSRMANLAPLPDELAMFPETLRAVTALLEERNLVIHGRVYAVPGIGDIRKPGRRDLPEQPATSVELYELANDLFAACSPLRHASMFALPRLLYPPVA